MTDKWWSDEDVAVVTGANKGIGYEIARLLAEAGFRVVAAARNSETGEAAVQKLRSSGSMPDGASVEFEQLDISDPASIKAFKDRIQRRHPDGLTVLINNAGIATKGDAFSADEAQKTIDTNFRGTANVCEALAPLLKDGRGRVVNVSSSAGVLSRIPGDKLRSRFDSPSDRQQLESLADEFVAAIRAGTYKEQGWPESMYGISKALVTAYTRALAKQLEGRRITVNCCCPGYVKTDMSSGKGDKTPAEGADTPVWLATQAPLGYDGADAATGGFWRDRQRQPF